MLFRIDSFRTKVLCMGAAMSVFAGCTKENVDSQYVSGETVPVSISVSGPIVTRATDTDGEDSVSSLQVFIFRPDGVLEAYSKTIGNTAKADCTVGSKDIIAVVNAPEIPGVKTKSALESKVSYLKDNAPKSFVMYGSKSETVSSASGTVTIPVTRLVSRISIKKITNRLELSQYESSKFLVKKIYIVNAAGDRLYTGSYAPTLWHNRGKCESQGDLPSLLSSGELGDVTIQHGKSYETPHYFYCYPNPTEEDSSSSASPAYTRLVVEVSIDGKIYYYPVSIKGVQSNYTYNISELIITRLGSESPDIPVSYHEASFTVDVAEWKEGSDQSVTI